MLKAYIIITLLLLIDLFLYLFFQISLAGQFLDKLLFWVWFIFTIVTLIKFAKSVWAKCYAGLLVLLIFLSLIPMGIPIISLISFATNFDEERRVDNFVLREGAKSPIAIPKIYLLKNKGLFEKEIADLDYQILFEDAAYYRLEEFDKINSTNGTNKLQFEFKIGNKSVIREFEKN